ncbi:MAG: right-handed parallel beta-helix repeat-containing protein, partial [Thiobacillus sp.]|nr:right-handed parallel beta-helix repeat-containing protein [Thiobacillus sp.]
KLAPFIDLITYGTFENGLGNWAKWSPQNNATMSLTSSCPQANNSCMSFTGGSGKSLVNSNSFTLQGKQPYTAAFSLKAPTGVTIWAILRRNAPPWDIVGLAKPITGTGAWQTVALPFTATASLPNARLEFVVPAGVNIGLDNVKMTAALTDVLGVFDSGKAINVAHHPNRGHDPLKPDSLYYAIAENADRVSLANGTIGSSYLTTGSDLAALAHPAIAPGTGVRIRTNAWTIIDRKIASVSGSRLIFDSLTPGAIEKDWGYFLYGQRWMLDEPGEWHYDAATKALSVWMADNAAPNNRISVGQRALGIEASNLSHIRIENLSIQNVGTGVRMLKANNVVLRNMNLFDTLGLGIDAPLSTDSGVEDSQISRTAGDAIFTDGSAMRFHAYENLITDSSIQSTNGILTGLPGPSKAAIGAGRSAIVRGNRIYGAGYIGIRPHDNSLVSGNHVENTCLVLDDCAAIYINGQNNNSTIENNTVLHVVGGLAGKPAYLASQSQGIYLDDLTTGATVSGNTAVDADNGIQLHNAANNRVENNTLYGNRHHQLWLQEGSKRLSTEGDVYDNLVLSNRLFSTQSIKTVIGQSTGLAKDNTHRFASFDNNRYFTLSSPTISTETWPSGGVTYTLPEWQAATLSGSLPRNLDPSASEVNNASFGYATFSTMGGNAVPNGNLAAGHTGWTAWNQTAPYGQMVLETCTPTSQCLRYTAGASVGLLSSPNFSVQQDQWYKVSFDLRTGTNGQSVFIMTRRGGGGSNGYEILMNAPVTFTGSTTWQRYGYLFKAVKTVNAHDPITLDKGARVDFGRIDPGQNISVTNLEVVPISAIETSLRHHILINPTDAILTLDCPDGAASTCNDYVRFTDSQIVTWPYDLPPHGSEIIYTRDSRLTDGDGDGIPDYQDLCSGTGASKAVNARGCTLGQ